jgi:flagellar protein FliS
MTQLPRATHRYLDARVTTASQPELHLMLLDGALRFGRQAQQTARAADQGAEYERLLGRTLDIVEELVRSVAVASTDASKRLEEEYAFAFRQLAAAQIGRDADALESGLRLLAFERETWKLACDKLKTGEPAARVPTPALSMAPMPEQGLSLQG